MRPGTARGGEGEWRGAARLIPPLLALALPFAVIAVGPEVLAAREPMPQEPSPQEPWLHQVHPEAREAISKIRSPFCPGQMLEVCPSRQAEELRDSLDRRARDGISADSLVELVIAIHGEEYRALPRRTGAGLLAWVIPPAALLVGAGLVVVVLRRLKGPGPVADGEGLTEEQRDRLDAALAELEELEEME